MQIKKPFLIGLALLLTVTLSAPMAQAYFSPAVSSAVEKVKSDIRASRTQNGTGSFTNIIQKFQEPGAGGGGISAVSGDFVSYFEKIGDLLYQSILKDSLDTAGRTLDSFTLAFGWLAGSPTVSSCLRDDLWALEDVENVLIQELFKSSALYNRNMSDVLWQDYAGVGDKTKKIDGIHKTITELKNFYRNLNTIEADDKATYFYYETKANGDKKRTNVAIQGHPYFEAGTQDYYADCPYNEFESAAKDVLKKWNQNIYYSEPGDANGDGKVEPGETVSHWFSTIADAYEWGNIASMAKANAKRRAEQYLSQNKIKVGVGGPQGGNKTSILEGDPFKAFDGGLSLDSLGVGMGDRVIFKGAQIGAFFVKTALNELELLKGIVGPFDKPLPIFSKETYLGKGIDTAECVIFRPQNADTGYWDNCTPEEAVSFKNNQCGLCEPANFRRTYSDIINFNDQHQVAQIKNMEAVKRNFDVKFADSNSEDYLTEIRQTLGDINGTLSATYSKKDYAAAPLPQFYTIIDKLVSNQCKNTK